MALASSVKSRPLPAASGCSHRRRHPRPWTHGVVAVVVLAALGSATAVRAQYARAGWEAQISRGLHSVQAVVTIVDDHTLQVDGFTYDGLAPLVYFYLGATDDDTAFQNGLQLEPLLDRPYANESLTLTLPAGETLDPYGAVAVWCAEFMINFGSAAFVGPPTAVGDEPVGRSGIVLHANYPNPFNPVTRIRFDLPAPTRVQLAIYAADGSRIVTLAGGQMAAGPHEVSWDGKDETGRRCASGTYFYRLVAGTASETRTMVLVK